MLSVTPDCNEITIGQLLDPAKRTVLLETASFWVKLPRSSRHFSFDSAFDPGQAVFSHLQKGVGVTFHDDLFRYTSDGNVWRWTYALLS